MKQKSTWLRPAPATMVSVVSACAALIIVGVPVSNLSAVQARGVRPRAAHPVTLYNDMAYLLRPTEQRRLRRYEELWLQRKGVEATRDPSAVFHLHDDPNSWPCWTLSGRLPCLTASMGILWHAASRSIVLPAERPAPGRFSSPSLTSVGWVR